MPLSDAYNIPWVIGITRLIKPKRILEVGIGTGIYGALLRQYLEIAYRRMTKVDWEVRIDGVEIFAPYRNPSWDYWYDSIIIGDIRSELDRLPDYDLVLLCDVIEHFEKEEGRFLLAKLLGKSRYTIVTTPGYDYPQADAFGNEFEAHRSIWRTADFGKWPCWSATLPACLIIILANTRDEISSLGLNSLPRVITQQKRANARAVIRTAMGPRGVALIRKLRQRLQTGQR